MPELNEREQLVVYNCNHCKYCAVPWGPRLSKDGKLIHEFRYLCMLDSSEETRKRVQRELSKLMHEDVFTVQSEELRQILQLKESDRYFTDSPRCVSDMCCCQFYELKDHWKDTQEIIVKPLPVFMLAREEKEEEQDELQEITGT